MKLLLWLQTDLSSFVDQLIWKLRSSSFPRMPTAHILTFETKYGYLCVLKMHTTRDMVTQSCVERNKLAQCMFGCGNIAR